MLIAKSSVVYMPSYGVKPNLSKVRMVANPTGIRYSLHVLILLINLLFTLMIFLLIGVLFI